MSDASVEVLLDDFEDKEKWEIAGDGAARTHLTTFAEGAPAKDLGVYADGASGADYRALVLLVRSAADGLGVDLVAKPGRAPSISGRLEAVNLWVRSPHASLEVSAQLSAEQETHDVLLGEVPAQAEWQRLQQPLPTPITAPELSALRIRLTEVIKQRGEVMILLDDLTAHTTG